MKKVFFCVNVEKLSFDLLNKAIYEKYGEHEWYLNDKHMKMDIKSGELEFNNGVATIYDID